MKRTERFGLVMSPQEKTAMRNIAEHEGGLSYAALLRTLIRRAAYERGLWPSKRKSERKPNISEEPLSAKT